MSTLITDKVENAAVQKEKLDTSAYLPHTPWLQFLLVCCLFALWGMAGNLNDILIEEDNVRFLLIRGPDGERLEFDACKR